jgi:hypothetical protein
MQPGRIPCSSAAWKQRAKLSSIAPRKPPMQPTSTTLALHDVPVERLLADLIAPAPSTVPASPRTSPVWTISNRYRKMTVRFRCRRGLGVPEADLLRFFRMFARRRVRSLPDGRTSLLKASPRASPSSTPSCDRALGKPGLPVLDHRPA